MQTGDVVHLGRHRLMCGDAFSAEHRARLVAGRTVSVLYCDPPYGAGLSSIHEGMRSANKRNLRSHGLAVNNTNHPRAFGAMKSDDAPFDPSEIVAAFDGVDEQFWWGGDYYAERIPGRNEGAWFVWDKRGSTERDKMFGSGFELCWSRARHKRTVVRIVFAGVWGMTGLDTKRVHPTQKPVRLAEWFLSRYAPSGGTVCDLFAGSGSSLLACERLGLTCLSMEIEPDYCDLIIHRYQKAIE